MARFFLSRRSAWVILEQRQSDQERPPVASCAAGVDRRSRVDRLIPANSDILPNRSLLIGQLRGL